MAIFKTERRGERLTMTLPSLLVTAIRADLKAALSEAGASGAKDICLNCSETVYMDAASLGALVSAQKSLREAGGCIRLFHLNDDLRTLFELMKLDTLIPVVEGGIE